MKLIAKIVKSRPVFDEKVFHVRLPIGKRYFGHEDIVTRHIGKRPWSDNLSQSMRVAYCPLCGKNPPLVASATLHLCHTV